MKQIVYLKQEIIEWAVQESEYSLDFALAKNPFLGKALDGEPITFKQLQNLSLFFKIPFGYFFYNQVPERNKISAEFRTIGNKKKQVFSKNLKDVLLDMDYKKNWMSDYRKKNGYEKFAFNNYLCLNEGFDTNIEKIRDLLALDVEWYRNLDGSNSTFDFLKRRIESLGILVMESSVVGNNQNRKIDINDFRGFALSDEYTPLIFINNNDKNEARCFTLMHEVLHLLNESKDDIFVNIDNDVEKKINKYVAEILIPFSILRVKTANVNEIDPVFVKKMAAYFKVSIYAMAVRMLNFNIISKDFFDDLIDGINNYINKTGGGNYYANLELKTSTVFSNAVFESVYSNKITFTQGYKLLGLRGNTFDVFGGRTYAKH